MRRHHLSLLAVAVLAVPSLSSAAPPQAQAAPAPAPSAPPSSSAAPTAGEPAAPSSSGPSAAGKPAAPPSSQARALSRALVPKQTWDRLLDRSAQGLSEAVSRSLTTKGDKVPSGLQGNIRRELSRSLQYDSAVDTQAQALQKRFTPKEMESAAKFYSSPVGQKVLQQLPEAQSEVGDALQERLATVVPEIVQRVAPGAMTPAAPGGPAASPGGAPPAASPSTRPQGTGTSP